MTAHAFEVNFGWAKGYPEVRGILGFANQYGNVQECLAGNAPHLQARAAKLAGGVDQRDLKATVSGKKSSSVATGAATKNQ